MRVALASPAESIGYNKKGTCQASRFPFASRKQYKTIKICLFTSRPPSRLCAREKPQPMRQQTIRTPTARRDAACLISIEMQVNSLLVMRERLLYYWSRDYTDLKKGDGYEKLKRTVAINILNYNIFDAKRYSDMHSCFGFFDLKKGCQLTKQLEIHFLELKKFRSGNVREMNCMQKLHSN
ncbi:MAG: PD-(D/E)XK nuclease family transposase [Selenomonadaceae bacterium]|nr:PD-(D/E)XK nuclease family transposase [Selenomonadaceae bacterium]